MDNDVHLNLNVMSTIQEIYFEFTDNEVNVDDFEQIFLDGWGCEIMMKLVKKTKWFVCNGVTEGLIQVKPMVKEGLPIVLSWSVTSEDGEETKEYEKKFYFIDKGIFSKLKY